MTPDELEQARLKFELNKKELAIALKTPYRTVQDWFAGNSKIPGAVEVAVQYLLKDKTSSKTVLIHGAAVAVPTKAIAYKYASSDDGPRWIYDKAEADEIILSEPGLIVWVENVGKGGGSR